MISKVTNFNTVDAYIAGFPIEIQKRLNDLRATIRKTAPQAEEVISYQMPAYKYKGMLLYFAAHKNHIGFYPASTGIEAFKNELSQYKRSKGTIQFPHDKPMPMKLITQIIKFRIIENDEKAERKN
jgi:uncharacterized protein YdhG (YjbR/CyaY superfamily)